MSVSRTLAHWNSKDEIRPKKDEKVRRETSDMNMEKGNAGMKKSSPNSLTLPNQNIII